MQGSEYTIHLVLPMNPSPAGSSAQPSSVGGPAGVFNRPPTSRPFAPGLSASQTEPSSQGIRRRGQAASVTSNAQPHAADFQHQMDALEQDVQRSRALYERQFGLDGRAGLTNTATASGSSFASAYSAQYGLGNSLTSPLMNRSVHERMATPLSYSPTNQPTTHSSGSHHSATFPYMPTAGHDRFPTPTQNVWGRSASAAAADTPIDPSQFDCAWPAGTDWGANNPQSWPSWNDNNRATSLPGSASPNPATASHESFRTLVAEVGLVEEQLSRNVVPSLNVLFRLQTRILEIQNEQRQTPDHRLSPLAAQIERLQARIAAVYQRVDQLTLQLPFLQSQASSMPPSARQMPEVYLASSPDGYQGLVVPQGTTTILPQGPSAQPQPAPFDGANPAAAGAVENIVRQAVLNQQRRRNNAEAGLGHHIRRIWLFVRLYFFCYMISDTGTWTRVLLVSMAVLVALLSDTDIPQQLHGMVVAPVQRHLEGLAHMGGPAHQPVRPATNANTNQAVNRPPDSIPAEIWQTIRRAERSLVLLLASLVPGIGERQVEARNAAEAEAERGRQEQEQERERQREQAQSQAEQTQSDPAAAADNAGAATSSTQQPQPTAS